ncbi:MAG TPA: hypothetical protein VJ436_10245 [Anaerolineales bacterium]|nr:hypothetical protein [Anaerolineales bacterium]
MSEYEGCYVKLAEEATFWLVEDGERRAIGSVEEMYASGVRAVVVVKAGVLEAIPIKGFHHRDTERTEKSFKSSEKEEEKEE